MTQVTRSSQPGHLVHNMFAVARHLLVSTHLAYSIQFILYHPKSQIVNFPLYNLYTSYKLCLGTLTWESSAKNGLMEDYDLHDYKILLEYMK